MGVLSLIKSCRPQASITAIRCSLVPGASQLKLTPAVTTQLRQLATSLVRRDEHRHFTITPSRYSWNKYKDALHFYVMLGLIPGLTFVFLVNVFIGPAKLAPIPAGYTPQQHEYFKHPITRFIARYCCTSHQEDYERNLHYFWEEDEKRKMRLLADRVEELMAHRGDYPNYYVRPTIMGKYFRSNLQVIKEYEESLGQETDDVSIPLD